MQRRTCRAQGGHTQTSRTVAEPLEDTLGSSLLICRAETSDQFAVYRLAAKVSSHTELIVFGETYFSFGAASKNPFPQCRWIVISYHHSLRAAKWTRCTCVSEPSRPQMKCLVPERKAGRKEAFEHLMVSPSGTLCTVLKAPFQKSYSRIFKGVNKGQSKLFDSLRITDTPFLQEKVNNLG